MSSYTEEFESKQKPADYYAKLYEELERINEKFNAFNVLVKATGNGMPFSVKDNICVRGIETTASSKILKGYIPPFNATVVDRIIRTGRFSLIGKTNMDEFGFGSFGINCDKPAKNPLDEGRVPGGSSSGAAVATALLKYHVAIAESTGGSISAPAAFCGVVGFTPTYSVLSRYGLIDYANSLDKIGFMARSADDIKIMLDITKGLDKRDSTSSSKPIHRVKHNNLIIIKELMDKVEDGIKSEFYKFTDKLKGLGYNIKTVDFRDIELSIPSYYLIAMSEASTNLAKFTGFKYGFKVEDFSKNYNDFFTEARDKFGEEAKRRIILGTFIRSASVRDKYYLKSLSIRRWMIDKLSMLLKDAFIISPTMPILPPKIEDANRMTPVQNYASDILTIPANLGGFPHISIPFSYSGELPLSAQVIGSHFNDYGVISFASDWEKNFKYKFKYNLGDL
ncbi:MAG: aspartyl/glutamyl-tRNA amidotransferase subunit A [Candidatus Parvarchaeota archaeon]|nr:aspartyl/glutamyl-tRNA amidotransferase subunit A [Candidatus Parvarchaeota archaeon]MCW1302001.1 aspartyl/glutamyl-tRNA amidotransferase subunit A [Candidatus Parvarchaeota archaeon]